jgi:DNA-cytosine methyltransferase
MNVLSLFNGMSTGHLALINLGYKIDNYYSSEIKPYAIELNQYHYPKTIQLGDVKNWQKWDIDWEKIDLILSGSPCQDLSIAGNRSGINGSKSSLFWVFIDILNFVKSINPKVMFLQENVASAPKKDVGIMSRSLGVYPVRFNSKLVVGALRDRLYWSNIRTKPNGFFGDLITDIPQPKDRNIKFKDILTNGSISKNKAGPVLEIKISDLSFDNNVQLNNLNKETKKINQIKSLLFIKNNELRIKTNTTSGYDVITVDDCVNLSFPKSETRRGRVTKGKSPCLLEGGELLFSFNGKVIKSLNKVELCRLQGFPDNYCDILTRRQTESLVGDGWTLPIIEHILKFINN